MIEGALGPFEHALTAGPYHATVLARQALDDGFLKVGRLEIARLDNDPNFAERGVLRLTMEGGR